MPALGFAIDISGYVEEVEQTRSKDIPFATAKALTRVAQDAQSEVRRDAQADFTLRNNWTQQGIKITPAEKLSWPISAEVYTDTGNDKAPDYLEQQEDGGQKEHHGSPTDFAIPTKYLRAIAPATIPVPMRPRNLLPLDAEVGTVYRGRLEAPYVGKAFNRLGVRKLKKLGSAQYIAFKQYDRNGTLCIFVRVQGKRDAEPWYVLTPRAFVKAVLKMLPTVEAIVEERFETHWDDAWGDITG
jgi:hypothetical protein